MKRLIIVRHGKSSWGNLELSDHDRFLLPVGINRTQKIAKFLSQKGVIPDLIISSSAVRAVSTAQLIASEIGYDSDKIICNKGLYLADEDEIYDELFAIDNDIDSVMVFGHNPGFTYLANYFVNPQIENLPTSGVVCVDFNTDKWERIPKSQFKVQFVVTPKMIE